GRDRGKYARARREERERQRSRSPTEPEARKGCGRSGERPRRRSRRSERDRKSGAEVLVPVDDRRADQDHGERAGSQERAERQVLLARTQPQRHQRGTQHRAVEEAGEDAEGHVLPAEPAERDAEQEAEAYVAEAHPAR